MHGYLPKKEDNKKTKQFRIAEEKVIYSKNTDRTLLPNRSSLQWGFIFSFCYEFLIGLNSHALKWQVMVNAKCYSWD